MMKLIEVRSRIENVHRRRLIELIEEVGIVAHIVAIVFMIDQARGTIVAIDYQQLPVASSVQESMR